MSVDHVVSTGVNCDAQCPTCQKPCLGGPKRYADKHMCRDLHQWPARETRRPYLRSTG